jgi:hypothetical protein
MSCLKNELSIVFQYDGAVKRVQVKAWNKKEVDRPMIILQMESGR